MVVLILLAATTFFRYTVILTYIHAFDVILVVLTLLLLHMVQ
jgi:hypothetical protein